MVVNMPRGPLKMMYRVYRYALPEVSRELAELKQLAERIPNGELRAQALASLRDKRFHCQGGSVYAIGNLPKSDVLLPLIVALQTISDYLDNLCDRSTSLDPADFRLLHQSMLDAVTPDAQLRNYYELREDQDDGGYLHHLVRTCQKRVQQLPSYKIVMPHMLLLVQLYGDLQVYKHIHEEKREGELKSWWLKHRDMCPHLQWHEFAAATGSTLGMFMLMQAASREDLTEAEAVQIYNSYFPHVCALHILLDYLIDQAEDRAGGDLNFCFYYENDEVMAERLERIVQQARADVLQLPSANFHRLIIEGLLALYLSDPKVRPQSEVRSVSRRLMKRSPLARLFFLLNSIWIRKRQV